MSSPSGLLNMNDRTNFRLAQKGDCKVFIKIVTGKRHENVRNLPMIESTIARTTDFETLCESIKGDPVFTHKDNLNHLIKFPEDVMHVALWMKDTGYAYYQSRVWYTSDDLPCETGNFQIWTALRLKDAPDKETDPADLRCPIIEMSLRESVIRSWEEARGEQKQ